MKCHTFSPDKINPFTHTHTHTQDNGYRASDCGCLASSTALKSINGSTSSISSIPPCLSPSRSLSRSLPRPL